MKLYDELKRSATLLSEYPGQWAVCGGIAASIYRVRPRYTDDIDFAVIDSERISAKDLACKIINQLGYKEYLDFVPDSQSPTEQVNGLVCARDQNNERFKGFDFLLPNQIWVQEAVMSAQDNFIDYGFASLPTITAENLVFAKLIAINNSPERYQDMHDIKEILAEQDIYLESIKKKITNSKIEFKPEVLKFIERN